MKFSISFSDRLFALLTNLLKQGLSRSKLALVLALGMTLSVFPVPGTTTLLCTIAALAWRHNLVAIQIANYIAFPFQIILFFPFLNIGENISKNSVEAISKVTLSSAFEEGFFHAINALSEYLILASIGWALAAVPIFFLSFYFFKFIFNKYKNIF